MQPLGKPLGMIVDVGSNIKPGLLYMLSRVSFPPFIMLANLSKLFKRHRARGGRCPSLWAFVRLASQPMKGP
jgi:hypothetical protein